MKKPKSKYTKRQRNKIYKKALVVLERDIHNDNLPFCCCSVHEAAKQWPTEVDFPEFFSLKPKTLLLDDGCWFRSKNDKSNNERRVLTLLFAIEMSN